MTKCLSCCLGLEQVVATTSSLHYRVGRNNGAADVPYTLPSFVVHTKTSHGNQFLALVCFKFLRGKFLRPADVNENIAHAHHVTTVNYKERVSSS